MGNLAEVAVFVFTLFGCVKVDIDNRPVRGAGARGLGNKQYAEQDAANNKDCSDGNCVHSGEHLAE